MARERRQYSEEFKREAVRLAYESGRRLSDVARELDVGTNLIRRWRRKSVGVEPGRAPTSDQREILDLQSQLSRVREERDILKKSVGDLLGTAAVSQRLVRRLAERHSVQRVCKVLGVSRSGYYARRGREAPARVREDRRLKQQILAAHTEAQGRYGTPRIERALRRKGIATSRKRVARLRHELGLRAKERRRFRVTTDSRHAYQPAQNRLKRRFQATRPNQLWVGDITYMAQGRRWLYLAVLMDLYSRRIVGWSLSDRIDEQLTLTALRRALESRRPPAGLIHHTDRGAQCAGRAYRQALEAGGLEASMSRRGDCWNNAPAESLIKTIKTELGRRFLSRELAHRELFAYIEGFYNSTRRLHSGLDYRTPIEAETLAPQPLLTQISGALSLTAIAARSSASPHPGIR